MAVPPWYQKYRDEALRDAEALKRREAAERLAHARKERMVEGRPVFGLSQEECRQSSAAASRLENGHTDGR